MWHSSDRPPACPITWNADTNVSTPSSGMPAPAEVGLSVYDKS